MQQVSFPPSSAQTISVRSRLDVARITSEVRNEALSPAVPGTPSITRLCDVCDDDYDEDARRLILSGAVPRRPE